MANGTRVSCRGDDTPTSTATSRPAAITVTSAQAFDPQGSGTPGENNDQAPFAIDGRSDTSWRTERYDQQDFGGTKRGVGLVIALDRSARVDHVDIDSPTSDWSASIFVSDAPPDGTTPNGVPSAQLDGISGTARFNTAAATGRYVLLWITRLGTTPSRFSVAVNEVRVVGRP